MADEDRGPDEIAAKLGESGDDIRKQINLWIEGKDSRLDPMSDLAAALAREWDFSFTRSIAPPAEDPAP